jgi:hypothetical protein
LLLLLCLYSLFVVYVSAFVAVARPFSLVALLLVIMTYFLLLVFDAVALFLRATSSLSSDISGCFLSVSSRGALSPV